MVKQLKIQLQRYPAVGITSAYLIMGLLWIFFSDQFLQIWLSPEQQVAAQTLKGFLYVLLTGMLLFGLSTYFTSELRAQNRRYRMLFEENPLPMWICHPETLQILDTNLSACRQYGYDYKTFTSMYLGDLEHISPPLILSQLNQHLPMVTLTHHNHQGQTMDIWLSFQQLPQGLLVAAHDITSQKQAERQLRSAKQTLEQFRFAVASASVLLVLDTKGQILDSNANFQNMLQQSPENVQQQCITELGQFSEMSWPEILGSLTQEPQVRTLLKLAEHWIDCVILNYGTSEQADSLYLLLGQDISQQQHLKQEQEQLNQTLVQQNQDLHQFTYIVSHNLRAPAANILGLLDIFNHNEPADPFNQQVLEKLQQSAESLDNTLKDLNEILHNRGNIVRQQEWIALRPLIEQILNSLEYLLPKDVWQLNLDLQVDSTYSTRAYLNSILSNLISNAIKYRATGRRLELSIAVRQDSNKLLINIQDNGRGLDLTRYGHKVFGFYQRFHQDTEGRGLGLYLVKTQVEMLGGSIDIESQLDQGTRFEIRLPVATPAEIPSAL
ncbi:MAG: PAS domain-containing protein [Candidatus Sericytochromatia bacterium]|nr:PAS domain-containing protein [Candidatus Sericytochromatia bacterium]